MRTPFFSLAAASSSRSHLIRHHLARRRRITSEECCRGGSRLVTRLPVDDARRVGGVLGDLPYRSFTTNDRPPGKNSPPSSKNKKKTQHFRTSNDNSQGDNNPETSPSPPLSPTKTTATTTSHGRRLVVTKNKEIPVDKSKETTTMTNTLGTFKTSTALLNREIRDSYGQLILKPAATTTTAATAQWQKQWLRNNNKNNQQKSTESSSAAAASTTTSASSAADNEKRNENANWRQSAPAPATSTSTSTSTSTRDEDQFHHYHPFPILNASVLLDTQRYIVRSGKFSATTTKSGTEAARRMLRGRKEWLQTVRKHVARGQQQYPTSSSSSNMFKQDRGAAYEIQGHGVPRQLLQNHIDFATKLLQRHRAWSVDFGAPPTTSTTTNNYMSSISPDITTTIAEDWTMQVLGMDGDPSSYRTAPVLSLSKAAATNDDTPRDDCIPQDDANSLQLYLTVMHRLATTLSILFREGPLQQQQQRPQEEQQQQQQQPENTPTTVRPTGLTSTFNDEYNNSWSPSSRGRTTAASTASSSSSSTYMYPTYYDWKVDISRPQSKPIPEERDEEEEKKKKWQCDDDGDDSLKNETSTTLSGGSSSNSSSKLATKEPLLTVQWNWPIYQVALYLHGRQSSSSSSFPRLERADKEDHNPIVTMKYAATFYPQHQQMSSRGRFS